MAVPAVPSALPAPTAARLPPPRVVLVALGSRGDVQPLALLASALASARRAAGEGLGAPPPAACVAVVLLSHAELEAPLRAGGGAAALSAEVEFRSLPLPCYLASKEEAVASESSACDGGGRAKRFKRCPAGGESIGGRSIPCVLDLGGRRRAEWVAAVLRSRDADVLVGNLFALPVVFHLAERLGVPWLVASPCLVPYSAPPGFEQSFSQEMPELFDVLRRVEPGVACGSGFGGGRLGWRDVCDWLWPLFTENHALLREELLGLPPVPGYDEHDRVRPEALQAGPLLLGLPSALLTADVRASLPLSARVCGAWAAARGVEPPLPPEMVEYLELCARTGATGVSEIQRPFYVGFGSMGLAGLVPGGLEVLAVAVNAARWMRCGAVIMEHLVAGESPSTSSSPAFRRVEGGCASWPGVLACRVGVSHEALLPSCSIAVHHGGIGTVIAAARAGIPQLVVPLAFDQPFWGSRVKELGVGDVLDLDDFTVMKLARALRQLLSNDSVRRRVEELRAALDAESGMETATEEILRAAAKPRGCRKDVPEMPLKGFQPVQLGEGAVGIRVWARCTGEARHVYDEIAVRGCYGDINSPVGHGIVVDAGLNLGLFSLLLAKAWSLRAADLRGDLVVFAFEPAAETYSLALRNLRENGVHAVDHGRSLADVGPELMAPGVNGGQCVIHCFQLALSSVDGEDELCYFPHLSTNSTLRRYRELRDRQRTAGVYSKRLVEVFFAEERLERVHAVRLDSLLQRLRASGVEADGAEGVDLPPSVALLKVDVEGAEAEVLAGIGEAYWAGVARLAVEVHSSLALAAAEALLRARFGGQTCAEEQPELDDHWLLRGERSGFLPQLGPPRSASVSSGGNRICMGQPIY